MRTRSPSTRHVADHAEVDERDDRYLGVGNLVERGPDGLGRHHCAPGIDRRTSVMVSQRPVELRQVRAAFDRGHRLEADAPRQLGSLFGLEHAERERPQFLDGGSEPRLVAQARRPQLRVQPVIGLLAVDLRCQARQFGVVRLHQAVDADAVGLLVEIAAGDRVRPLEQMQFDERRAAVVVRLAVERERVGVGVELQRRRARTARAHARSRSVRSTRTRRPPRASARSRSTPNPASRGSARRQRSTEGAMPARSRAMRNLSLIE